jgi:predicted dehydrogenase
MKKILYLMIPVVVILVSCGSGANKQQTGKSVTTMEKEYQVKLITVDPGHFHAALVQKSMYNQVSPQVYVYAPAGPDVTQHLARIASYNTRAVNPTAWNEINYAGDDFFSKMLAEKKGNVVVLSGNNAKKAEYISKSIDAGLNVLADKPMIIKTEDFSTLESAFKSADGKGLLLYDIMTERYEVTTILQKLLSKKTELFGTLKEGTREEPGVTKVSVHHFSKIVSGTPLLRPAWFFDTEQQGEGIVDVTTHLVDLVQWECFPEQILKPSDVTIFSARRWPTAISPEQFRGVTGLVKYPDYLQKDVKDGSLEVFSNGEFTYRLKGVFAKVSVTWNYQAPPGGGDTHYSVMHGTKCDLVIRQGAEEKFRPTLYVENINKTEAKGFETRLKEVASALPFDSISFEPFGKNGFKIVVPEKYRVSHEEHFGQVMAKYLEFLREGRLPEWEVQGMITKYFTTTSALRLAKETK